VHAFIDKRKPAFIGQQSPPTALVIKAIMRDLS
jgi:hypothetical protein